jgi:hypothetical protein
MISNRLPRAFHAPLHFFVAFHRPFFFGLNHRPLRSVPRRGLHGRWPGFWDAMMSLLASRANALAVDHQRLLVRCGQFLLTT